ncbi:hypothetical protein MCOR02_012395 [Pyricularia oryzae]|nr:hypothetical protein MCOR02_012395 [Pyricularia oryzae]
MIQSYYPPDHAHHVKAFYNAGDFHGYLILLLISWVAACVYSLRPSLSTSDYEDAQGKLSPEALQSVTTWTTAIRALNTVVAISTIPVVSAILAHAAVVYAQRQNDSNKLSPRQLLSLADEPWARLTANHTSGFALLGLILVTYSMRLKSSVTCDIIGYRSYPTACSGTQAFEGAFRSAGVQVKFCVLQTAMALDPGRDRRQIREELFLDSTIPSDSEIRNMAVRANYTARCVANSTRDYFELPNLRNGGGLAEPLHTTDGMGEILERKSNHVREVSVGDDETPSENTTDKTRPATKASTPPPMQQAPGPLVLALLAALGNDSFLGLASRAEGMDERNDAARLAAAASICARGLPLSSFTKQNISDACTGLYDAAIDPNGASPQLRTSPSFRLDVLVASWFAALNPGGPQGKAMAESALAAGLFFANEALLTGAAEPATSTPTIPKRQSGPVNEAAPRAIHSAMGTSIIKPSVTSAAIGILSFFLAVEAVVLAVLSTMACCSRTIGTRFKPATMLFAGAQLRDELIPPDKARSTHKEKGLDAKVQEKKVIPETTKPSKAHVAGGNREKPENMAEQPDLKKIPAGGKKAVHIKERGSKDSLVRKYKNEDSSGTPSRSSSISSWGEAWKRLPMPPHLGPVSQGAEDRIPWTVSFAEGKPETITVRRERSLQNRPLPEAEVEAEAPEPEQGASQTRPQVSGPYSGFCLSPTFGDMPSPTSDLASARPLKELNTSHRRGSTG